MVVPFSFEGANQKEGRNFHQHLVGPLGAAHRPNIRCSPEEGESQLDDDAQMEKVPVRVNNLHEIEGSFQELSLAFRIHRKGGFPHLWGVVAPQNQIFGRNAPVVAAAPVCPNPAASTRAILATKNRARFHRATPERGDRRSHIQNTPSPGAG